MNATARLDDPAGSGGRVLAVLDDAAGGEPVLELSSALARALQRELTVVYVESTVSLRAASLPFAQVLPYAGTGWLPLQRDDVEQGFRAQASRLRELAAQAALRHSVGWSLRVLRGTLAQAPELLVGESNLMFLAPGTPERPATPAIRRRPRPAPRVLVATDGDAASQRAQAMGRLLAQASSGALDVVREHDPLALGGLSQALRTGPPPDVLVVPRPVFEHRAFLPLRPLRLPVLVVD